MIENLPEIWKSIDDFPDYTVSNCGKVLSYKIHNVGVLLNTSLNKNGYAKLHLTNYLGKPKNVSLHRIVALAFIPNPFNLPQVNHKDGDKLNNNAQNLEWSTNLDNQKHRWKNDIGTFKLTNDDVNKIKLRIISGERNIKIANDYNIDKAVVSHIKHNKRWKHEIEDSRIGKLEEALNTCTKEYLNGADDIYLQNLFNNIRTEFGLK